MDKNQGKGGLKDATSKLHETTGKVTASNDEHIKGSKKLDGQSQHAVGTIKDAVKNGNKK